MLKSTIIFLFTCVVRILYIYTSKIRKINYLPKTHVYSKKLDKEQFDFNFWICDCFYRFIFIYIYTLLVCLFVCLYPINVKTAEPIAPKFLWDFAKPQGSFVADLIFKKCTSNKMQCVIYNLMCSVFSTICRFWILFLCLCVQYFMHFVDCNCVFVRRVCVC